MARGDDEVHARVRGGLNLALDASDDFDSPLCIPGASGGPELLDIFGLANHDNLRVMFRHLRGEHVEVLTRRKRDDMEAVRQAIHTRKEF